MTEINPIRKEWANILRDQVPGEVKVTRFCDDKKTCSVDVFTSRNSEGIVAATIGVMDLDQSKNETVQVFSEILMDVRGQNEIIGNVISTVGFYLLKYGWKAAPGIIFRRMVEMYDPKSPVPHVMFIPPFQWGTGMSKVKLSTKTVYPLLAVPISDSERIFVEKNGSDALETLWSEKRVDVLDWGRRGAA